MIGTLMCGCVLLLVTAFVWWYFKYNSEGDHVIVPPFDDNEWDPVTDEEAEFELTMQDILGGNDGDA